MSFQLVAGWGCAHSYAELPPAGEEGVGRDLAALCSLHFSCDDQTDSEALDCWHRRANKRPRYREVRGFLWDNGYYHFFPVERIQCLHGLLLRRVLLQAVGGPELDIEFEPTLVIGFHRIGRHGYPGRAGSN